MRQVPPGWQPSTDHSLFLPLSPMPMAWPTENLHGHGHGGWLFQPGRCIWDSVCTRSCASLAEWSMSPGPSPCCHLPTPVSQTPSPRISWRGTCPPHCVQPLPISQHCSCPPLLQFISQNQFPFFDIHTVNVKILSLTPERESNK